MTIKRFSRFLLVLILISMAVSPAFALGEDQRNLLLIGVMGLSPLIILWYFQFDYMDLLLLLFLATILVFPVVLHPETMRWSTVLYSVMFGLTFIAFKQLLKQNYFSILKYLKLLKYLIYAYFITLLIQQLCVLTGLPVFNQSFISPLEPWKLNSLAAEPSHSARIVALLMYSYISIKEVVKRKKYNFKAEYKNDKWVWLAFIWTMVTMVSSTAFLFIPIVLLKFVRIRNIYPLLVVFGIIIIIVNKAEITAFDRTFKTAEATLTLNEDAIIEADHSASFRIVPIIVLVKMINVSSLDDWFGHGVDYVSSFMDQHIPGGGDKVGGGGLLALYIEYGLISFVLFIVFSCMATFKKNDYLSMLFWFLLVFMNGVNFQIVWLGILLLFINNYFKKRIKHIKITQPNKNE